MAIPSDKNPAASQPGQPAATTVSAPAQPEPSVPATLAERLIDALQKTMTASSAKPAEGVITTDEKSRYLAELAAYKCLNDQADAISTQINSLDLDKARIRMVDSLDVVGDDMLLQQMLAALSYWQRLFAEKSDVVKTLLVDETKASVETMAVGASAAGVASLLTAVPSIIGLFRSDLDLKGQTVTTPSRTAMQMRVAYGIRNATVLLPQLRQVTNCTLFKSVLQTETGLRDYSRLLDQLHLKVIEPQQRRIEELEQQISKLKTDDADGASDLKGELTREKSRLQTPLQTLKVGNELLKDYDEFRKQANAPAEGGKPSSLQRACWRSVLIDSHITHLLYVEPVSMGGTEVIAKSMFNFGTPSLHYVGGCVTTFVLTDVGGEVLAADTRVATSQLDFSIKRGKRIVRLV